MKKNIFLIIILFSVVSVKSQNSNEKLSARYYLGQTKSYILYSITDGRILTNESQKLVVERAELYQDVKYMFLFSEGLCNKVSYIPNGEKSNDVFLFEVGVLGTEGWSISNTSFDGSQVGVFELTYAKGDKHLKMTYLMFLGIVDFEIL